MAKIEVTPVSSGYNIAALNATLQAIEDEFKNKVLYRNEEGSMQRSLDMNGNRVINLPDPVNEGDAVSFGFLQDSSAFQLTGLEYRGIWAAGVSYLRNNYVTFDGDVYIALTSHTSDGSFASDLGSGFWVVFSAGGGDLLSTNNLSDVANASTARLNLDVPSRAGVGASGNWPINALTADTAGTAVTAINANNATLLSGISVDGFTQKTALTGSVILPAGTTAQRDVSPSAGYTRFNTTLNQGEIYTGSSWSGIADTSGVVVLADVDQTVDGEKVFSQGLRSDTLYNAAASKIITVSDVVDGSA